jgi:phage gp29-like protein
MDKTNQYEQGTVLDDRGQPIKKKELLNEVATPSLTGVRNVWHNQTVASGLTPDRLAQILSNAANGDATEYLILAEEMEEKDLHYQSVLGTRKRAISGLDVTVESASENEKDLELAEAVRNLTRKPEFGPMIDDALDGLGKGYSVNEIIWDRSTSTWIPKQYIWRDPRFFKFDLENGRELRLLDEQDNYQGIPLAPYKFITHIPKLKSGLPIRGGLARLVAVAYMCKAYTLTDWLAFAEVFGMPLRVGRYGTNATQDDIRTLINAVANIGTDAAAVIPDSMRIDFESSATASGGDKLFQNLAEWLDRQISKAVLGQTMTSDDGSSQAQAKVHDDVRTDILIADAKQLENTLNRDLIKPFIDLNFGPQENYPRVQLPVPEPEDTNLLVTALEALVPLGLEVDEAEVRNKLGLRDPAKGAKLLGSSGKDNQNKNQKTAMNHMCGCSLCDDLETARNREQQLDALDELEQEAMGDWQQQMQPVIDPIQKLANECENYEEFQARLPELQDKMDSTKIIEELAKQTFKARGLGDVKDD